MKKIVLPILALILIMFSSLGFCEEQAELKAQIITKIMEVMDYEKQWNDTHSAMMRVIIQVNPQLAPLKEDLERISKELIPYDDFENFIKEEFVKAFTLEELNAILIYYQSPEGKSVLEKMPQIMEATSQFMRENIHKNEDKLTKAIEDALSRQVQTS